MDEGLEGERAVRVTTEEVSERDFVAANFPCRHACPLGTNVGGFVALAAKGRFEEAYQLARRSNPFVSVCGRVCAHPCESKCRRSAIDTPIQIRALERVVGQRCGSESKRPHEDTASVILRPRPQAQRAGSVVIVGAGPAGLTCAHDLALMGHHVTVLESAPFAGGMMRLAIPAYRLPRAIVKAEVSFIEWLGVEIRCGVAVGRDVTFEQLCSDYDAVFLATGCPRDRQIELPGAELRGVITAVDFLAHINVGTPLEIGANVVVVGGGDVAFDVARTARRVGAPFVADQQQHRLALDAAVVAARVLRRDVTLVAPESRGSLLEERQAIDQLAEEGVHLVAGRAPTAILGRGGRVRELETQKVSSLESHAGRVQLQTVPDTKLNIPCDTVLTAIGQTVDLCFLGPKHTLDLDVDGTIRIDSETHSTSRAGVYAGGDVAFGPRILALAMADGKRAAKAIDTQLTGRVDAAPELRSRVFRTRAYEHAFSTGDYEAIAQHSVPMVPVTDRSQSTEVERVMAVDNARMEAARCLHCWVNTVFDSSESQGTACVQCGECVNVCPMHCLELVSMKRLGGGMGSVALIKDEDACIRCGMCARHCPTGTITMEAFYRVDESGLVRLADQVV